jgi:hypothetical protein
MKILVPVLFHASQSGFSGCFWTVKFFFSMLPGREYDAFAKTLR